MDKCCVLKMVDNLLQNKIPLFPDRADLVSRWKKSPPERDADRSGSHEPETPSRSELLNMYINGTGLERSDRGQLRNLVGYLLDEGEKIPEDLSSWVHREYAGRNPRAKRGRPRLLKRDVTIVEAYMLLCMLVPDFSHEDAVEFIALRINRDTETVRPIVRIVREKTGMDWTGMRDLFLQETP